MNRLVNSKNLKVPILIAGLSLFCLSATGQNLSLKQCIDYAKQNSSEIKNSNYDLTIAKKKVEEQAGTMLPQIDASGSYTDNLKLSTTVLPGELMGQPGTSIPIKMGTQHNISAGIQLSQKIYDPAFGISLEAARLSKEQSGQLLIQTTESIFYNVSSLYYQTLIIEKQKNSLQLAFNSSKASLESTELKFKNGMAKKIDVDKIRVSFNNTQSQLQQSELNYKQSLNNLKYYMGMPVDSLIGLSDTILNIESQIMDENQDSFSFENRSDYQLQKITENSYLIDKKRNTVANLPSLSFNAYYGYSAMRNEFDFFKGGDWYQSSYIGLSLKIPIFSGFQRYSRISQSKLNIERSKMNTLHTQEAIKVELTNSQIEYRNAIDNIQNEKDNLDLAESVFKNTQLQYQQGSCSSLDLIQAESSFRESLNTYYNKLLKLYIARINLEQSKGTLSNYINSLK